MLIMLVNIVRRTTYGIAFSCTINSLKRFHIFFKKCKNHLRHRQLASLHRAQYLLSSALNRGDAKENQVGGAQMFDHEGDHHLACNVQNNLMEKES
jgi:hypothetical protein